MSVLIPDEVVRATRMTETELKLEIALLLFQKEKLTLAGRETFGYCHEETRVVACDAYVHYRGNRHSVPWTAAGRQVTVWERGDRLDSIWKTPASRSAR